MNNARPIGPLARRIGVVDTLIVCSDLPLGSVDPTALALPPEPPPYALPTIDSGDTVVVTAWWLQDQHSRGIDVVKQVLIPLHDKFRCVIGLDHHDAVSPIFPDEWMSAMDVILKMNGIYKDWELYNFSVGAATPDGRWTEKTDPAPERFSLFNLRKFVLSIPCFLYISPQHRALMRSFYGTSLLNRSARALGDQVIPQLVRSLGPLRSARFTVYFAGRLSHIQRLDAARRLRRSSLRWRGGITHIPPYVQGLNRVLVNNPFTDRPLAPAIREELLAQLTAENLLTPRLSRYRHMLMMRDCKAVLSITGYGELCFLMAEAWASRRVLVCQDLSHVRTMFPFAPGKNVVYCRPDLTDLVDILDDIECNYRNYAAIADQGYRDWRAWSGDVHAVTRQGFAPLTDGLLDE